MSGAPVFTAKLKLTLAWLGLFALFAFCAGCLPNLLPEQLRFLATALAWLAWLAMIVVMVALWGCGPLGKNLNQAAIAADEERRSKYRVRQPWE